jgi:peptidoglycan biosynthesis protein MviN/MurJ (putative lipid II flippase)
VNTRRFVVWNLLKVGIIWKVMISFLCVSALYATGHFWEPARTPWIFGLVTFIGALAFWYDYRFIIGQPLECVPAMCDREVQR